MRVINLISWLLVILPLAGREIMRQFAKMNDCKIASGKCMVKGVDRGDIILFPWKPEVVYVGMTVMVIGAVGVVICSIIGFFAARVRRQEVEKIIGKYDK